MAGPFELADKSILDAVCEVAIELKTLQAQQNKVFRLAGQKAQHTTLIDRHMEFSVMRDLCFDERVQSVVSECFGNDLIVYGSVFQLKYEGVGANRWHHDRTFENGSEPINLYDTSNHFSLVFALTDVGMDQGRIEYVKGSHLPIDGFDREMRFLDELPEVVKDRVTPVTFKRGQFAVFHSSLVHWSLAFGHGERRISLAVRLARKGTEIPENRARNSAGEVATFPLN